MPIFPAVYKKAPTSKGKTPEPTTPKAPERKVFGIVEHAGKRFVALRGTDDLVQLCVPSVDGILLVTESRTEIPFGAKFHELGKTNTPAHEEADIRAFEANPTIVTDEKAMTIVRDSKEKIIQDYLNLSIEGFASTFKSTTPADRDGDAILSGAFRDTLSEFKTNPVLLMNHRNQVESIAGSFTKLTETSTGLAVQASISNAPDLRSIRFLIAEKHLRAFSIGGFFRFSDKDAREVVSVRLFEISLVAVPANPDALFHTRGLSIDDAEKAFSLSKAWKF